MIPFDRAAFEAYCKQAARSTQIDEHTALCRVLGGLNCYVDTRDRAIAPWLMLDGFWEAWISVELARVIKPGDHVIDAGANVGYYTLLAADRGARRVVAVEPQPNLAKCLRLTRDANELGDVVEIVEAALVDHEGTVEITVGHENMGGAGIGAMGTENIEVQATTIDTLASSDELRGRVDFIKVDVEGAEEAVWAGMQKTVAGNPQLVVAMEFNPVRYRDPRGFLERLVAPGFALASIEPGGVIPCTAEQVLRSTGELMLLLRRNVS